MAKYTIGIDYGTLSGRAVLVNVENGEELASSVFDFPHGVMDKSLPDGTPLGHDWALQHPQDYLDVLTHTIPAVLAQSGVSPADVIGVATDFTACTVLPTLANGTPLCFLPQWQNEPNAYVKLWKHHAAQDKANRLNEIAAQAKQPWLANYGGKISSEWSIPKLWQVLDEAPGVYDAMERWVEAADWIVWQLCGQESRNSCAAGYKALHHKAAGYPANFLATLDPRFAGVVEKAFGPTPVPPGTKVGTIRASMAAKTGLLPGTAVAAGNVDAHVCIPAVGIDGPGKMLAIVGTSTCHMLMDTKEVQVPGICGVVADGILPGFFGYEAGQSCVGDHFSWFISNCLPVTYVEEAAKKGVTVHDLLSQKAAAQKPGESGLLALDWWNGNRSVLVDVDLSGMLLGLTLATKPEEIYRALLEATAFGTKMIVENFRANGVAVNEFYASGGISQKNPFMMQMYADVLDMPVKIAASSQGPALGSAIFAAVAAGRAAGGYSDVFTAASAMGKTENTTYTPNPRAANVYVQLYKEYERLHNYFGRGENDVMKRLKALKSRQAKG